ncbi:hypothetical protein AB4039_01990 [Streptomyces sp. M-16]|uniref:hypothetical protein n=1 Tax=Streptomyces sp. M-16 TaxID=3233040 RepID=UPI003F9A3FDB
MAGREPLVCSSACGYGAEHSLKAILCHHDPLLISPHGDRALRFHALGFSGEKGVKPLEQARTIGMAEAFKDAEVVMRGQMPVTLEAFTPVMDARNGIAHLAHHDPTTGEHVVATALKVAEAVRKVLKTPARDFWGDYVHVIGDLAQVAAMPDLPEIDLQRALPRRRRPRLNTQRGKSFGLWLPQRVRRSLRPRPGVILWAPARLP